MTDFPDRVYVTLTPDEGGAEELRVAFTAEDCDEGPIAVYELRSVGRNETRFIESEPTLEHSGPCSIEDISRAQ